MSELLAPAGSMEALQAAIANGCDAVYLGMQKFGARAYSSNFDEEGIAEAVAYAHLRDVKVYVTVNTIAYQDELPEIRAQLDYLNSLGVDGVIAQDLAVLTYIAERYVDMAAHCSTQMGIDDLEGALLVKQLGARRAVLAREVEIERVKQIRRDADLPVEIFIHGALCVSFSGNCIMSGMTGNRLGNRGRCIGSCRKLYDVVDMTSGDKLGRNYILSTKDLCTIDYVDELEGIDSLKIEGRMKEPIYVANVVSRYRMALDGRATDADKEKLNRTFNRTFTRGYVMHEDRRDITNVEKPNNYGYAIGEIVGRVRGGGARGKQGGRQSRGRQDMRGMYELRLTSPLRQNDVIRIRHDGEDVNLSAARIYDASGLLVNSAEHTCFLKIREDLAPGNIVYITKDFAYTRELEAHLTGEYRRFPLDFTVHAHPGAPLVVDARGLGQACTYTGDEPLSEARSMPPTQESVAKQLDRLNDTVFELGTVELDAGNAFIPAKLLNAARKAIVEQLYQEKIASWPRRLRCSDASNTPQTSRISKNLTATSCTLPASGEGAGDERAGSPTSKQSSRDLAGAGENHAASALCPAQNPRIVASATTQEQYDACRAAGLDTVFFRNIVPRNNNDYQDLEGELLVGGLGGIERYRRTNPFVTDYSLNVVNAETVHLLHALGAERVTLSYEINEHQLNDLLGAYQQLYASDPRLEMIVYGRAPLLVTKYCPLKKMDQCGKCRSHSYEIRDEYGTFPILAHDDCTTTVLNGRILNLLDEMPAIAGIEAFRLAFTTESAEEVARIVEQAKAKLAGALEQPLFDPNTDSRGHYHKEIL